MSYSAVTTIRCPVWRDANANLPHSPKGKTQMKPISLLLCILLNSVLFAGNEGGHGGDTVINRILLARLFALQIVARAGNDELTADQKTKMQEILSRDAVFSKPGEHVVANDDTGNPIEVSASYDEKMGTITFNVDLCQTQVLSELDAIMLYLHEAGHAVGLSKNMAARRQDFTSDIGYRLVEAELQRPDSVLSPNSILAPLLTPPPSPNPQSPLSAPSPEPSSSSRPWIDTVTNAVGAHASALFQTVIPTGVQIEFRLVAADPAQQGSLHFTQQAVPSVDKIAEGYFISITNDSDHAAKYTLQTRSKSGGVLTPGTRTFIAISISPSTGIGSTSMLAFTDKTAAENAAINNCRQGLAGYGLAAGDCQVAVSSDKCVALAMGDGAAYGWAAFSSPQYTNSQALESCAAKTTNCVVQVAFCTPGSPAP